VSRSLGTLVENKRIVAVDVPAGRADARLRRYRIADSYLRFWFRFIEPHQRNIEVGRSDLAIRSFRSSWPSWRGKAVEPMVREALWRLAPGLEPPLDTIESVDGWWDRTGRHEYDLVASGRDRPPVAVGSIKWREKSSFDSRDLGQLAEARSVIPGAGSARLVAVAPRGIATQARVDLVLDAADLLEAWQT
jgi:AAA+ ATPase superfamily predicted ATPase